LTFPLYEFLNELSKGQVVQKTLDKEYNYMVSPLYGFLCVSSNCPAMVKEVLQWGQMKGLSPV
jgi:hypothetical protein